MSAGTGSSEGLRAAMVDQLAAEHADKGLTMRPEVEAALRAVPRHLFTPNAALEEAYRADQAVITKRVGDEVVSSVSASWLIAEMLGQAADAAGGLCGRRVLEGRLRRLQRGAAARAGRAVGIGHNGGHRPRGDRAGHGMPSRGGLRRRDRCVRGCRAADRARSLL